VPKSVGLEEPFEVPILPPEFQTEFVRIGHQRSFPKNEANVREGELAEAFYLIQEGQLRVFISDQNGREAELNVLGAGEYFTI
jgi:CRP/FNR family transcriptional regulator, cyclic AMP receptor protein